MQNAHGVRSSHPWLWHCQSVSGKVKWILLLPIGKLAERYLQASRSLVRLCQYRYGPFWVATTLIFVSAVTGNYASYISYKHSHSGSQTAIDSWYYDIDKVRHGEMRHGETVSTSLQQSNLRSKLQLSAGRIFCHPVLRLCGNNRLYALCCAQVGLQGRHNACADLVCLWWALFNDTVRLSAA